MEPSERCIHYLGGPLDGHLQLTDSSRHPFAIDVNTDTDGYYALQYQAAGQRIGDLTLTGEDIIARWHQRTSPTDFQVGDIVIVIATGERGTALAPLTQHSESGADAGWIVAVGDRSRFVHADEIRVATPSERHNRPA